MNPFGDSPKASASDGITADDWKSIASGVGGGDDDGFLNPESNLPSNRSLKTSDWSRERSAQQLELEDTHDGDGPGCCGKIMERLVMGLHVINVGCGFASMVYGSLLVSKFERPAMAAAMFCLILGVVHQATSLAGIVSYFARSCSRFGLRISAFVGPYVAFIYLTIIVTFIADEGGFLKYLEDNHEVMYLSPNVAENAGRLMPMAYTFLSILGVLEAFRFSVMRKLHDRLLSLDHADDLKPKPSWYEKSKNQEKGNEVLTEALLEGGGGGDEAASAKSGSVLKESTGTPN
eukprot:CAMPEP_0172554976 /NCGR_PEP_ID=MMETSP1067-20121228/57410_1 /TAXON_ID=265564 ORGANISM="Thalassiosira punctigera, Strain Tpunct2005C2" /NCGR_SAMPLE_ID=MMETSP1067 /ASSEMBLY_ACC=CAM_ASM_000444 /LENGTH=290 /DNA_ID=CAMNT_0013343465 /DNA_START=124 /DNA_END=993 /DNA_ORIENTATION=+